MSAVCPCSLTASSLPPAAATTTAPDASQAEIKQLKAAGAGAGDLAKQTDALRQELEALKKERDELQTWKDMMTSMEAELVRKYTALQVPANPPSPLLLRSPTGSLRRRLCARRPSITFYSRGCVYLCRSNC